MGLEGLFDAKNSITFKMETSSTAKQSQTSTTSDNIHHSYTVCPRTVLGELQQLHRAGQGGDGAEGACASKPGQRCRQQAACGA